MAESNAHQSEPRLFPVTPQALVIKDELGGMPEERKHRAFRVLYNEELGERITDLYLSGMSLLAISRMDEMPSYSAMMQWSKQNESFRYLLNGARETRARDFEERAIDAAEQATDSHDTPAQRLKFDAYKWGAEVNDPSRYGKRTTVAGDPNAPLQFIVSTGFPEPNAYQKPPELGTDGLIKRAAKEAVDVVVETASIEPTEADLGRAEPETEISCGAV